MPIDPSTPEWNATRAAAVAELSEAHAYVAMARAAAADDGGSTVAISALADGIALRCPGDRSSTLFNRVLGLGLRRPFDAGTVAAVAALFGDHDGPWGLELAPLALHEHVRALLKQLRLRRSLPTAMLAMDCRELDRQQPAAWRVERVGADHAALAAEVVERVFGISASVARILRRAPSSAEFGQWVAFDGARPVAACLTHVRGDTAWFGWSATLPSHRGRGLQSALLQQSVRDAGERGCRWITAETATGTADAPDASFRNMKRFGFVELYRRHGYLCLPPRGTGTNVRSAASWARSRF
jgi:GNAT superfamily N-acetyltransferase